jgi:DNA polymerase III epsilon subunit-like protein
MKYVSIDIETTGLDPETCEILEVAAIIDTDRAIPIEKLPTFRFRFVKDVYQGEPFAFSMHKELLKDLAMNPVNVRHPGPADDWQNIYGRPFDFSNCFGQWLNKWHVDPLSFVAAGKNFANFDAPFMKKLVGIPERLRWHHRILDPGNMFVLPSDRTVPGTDDCCERAGVNPRDFQGSAHTAIYDAKLVVALIRKGFERNGQE